MTSELSKLLHEIKKCRDRDYSFEELCHTISSHSMDSFGSGRLSDEERPDRPNGTLTRVNKVQLSVMTEVFDLLEKCLQVLLIKFRSDCLLHIEVSFARKKKNELRDSDAFGNFER